MSTTRTAYRRAVAAELGGYALVQALGVSTTLVLSLPIVLSSELPTSALAYQWVFVPSIVGLGQARVKAIGVNGATAAVTLEKDLGAAIASGTLVELHARLPAIASSQRPSGALSVDECVNLALRHLLTRDDTGVTVSLVSGQREYGSLPTWLDRADRLLDVRHLDALGGAYVSTWRQWEFRENGRGSTLYFENPPRFSSGSYSARLVVMRPADTLIKVSGSWGDSTTGLVNESDEAAPDLNDVVTVALAFAYWTLRDARNGPAAGKWGDRYAAQVVDARKVRNYNHSIDPFTDVPKTAPSPGPAATVAA